jgi:NAD/NADP transhydrogenase beta subunit
MAIAPRERLIVMIIGSNSGVNPTARATANSKASSTTVLGGVSNRNNHENKDYQNEGTCIIR